MRVMCNLIVIQSVGNKRTNRASVFSLLICLLGMAVFISGCGLHPQPVEGHEVSPVQLRSRPQPKAPAEMETPQAVAHRTEPAALSAPIRDDSDPMESMRFAEEQRQIPTQVPAEPIAMEEIRPAATALPQVTPPTARPPVTMPALTEPGMEDELVSVNFEEVDIRTVLKTIGEVTGINFIPHQSVAGNITVMSPTPIRLGDMYTFLQSILDVYGYATIESENAVKIVSKAEATRHSTQVRIGADPAYIPRIDAVVTQILPLQYAEAAEISEVIRPNLAAGAQMATYPRTNSIMITDTSANIHHVAQIIQQLDVEGSRERILTIPLTFASAQVLSEQIIRILDKSGAPVAPAARGRITPLPGQTLRVLPDERTNSVVAVGNEQDLDIIRQLVRQLDVPRPTGAGNVQVAYLKNADANEVEASLERALASMRISGAIEATQPIQITAHGSTNSLIIVASPQDYEMISQIIEKIDIVREQVLVEAVIMEVTEEALKQIGIDWATLDDIVADSVRGFAMTNLGPRVDFLNGDLEGLAVGAWKGTDSDVRIGVILQALERTSGVNILSTPRIMTTNHRKARIVVGENRPFVKDSRITETTDFITPTVIRSFEYQDVGITLEVTPHVSQGGLVRLEVDSEFTKLIDDVAASSLGTPVTAKRSAQTVVSMNSGTTVVIGGLIRDDTTRVTQQVPIVGNLPIVGPLFRSQRDRLQKTNLLIFITPRIMTSEEQLVEATNELRQEMLEAQMRGK